MGIAAELFICEVSPDSATEKLFDVERHGDATRRILSGTLHDHFARTCRRAGGSGVTTTAAAALDNCSDGKPERDHGGDTHQLRSTARLGERESEQPDRSEGREHSAQNELALEQIQYPRSGSNSRRRFRTGRCGFHRHS